MEKKESKTKIVFKYIFLSLYVICTCCILGLSLQDGQKSSDLSGNVGNGIAGIIDGADNIIHGGDSKPSEGGSESGGGEVTPAPTPRPSIVDRLKEKGHDFYLIVRKLFGHFGAFVVLGALACVVYLSFIKNHWISIPVMIGAGALTAVVSELLQLIPEGRCCTIKDMGIDFSGFLLSAAIGIAIYFIVYFVKRNKAKKAEQLN